MNSSNSNLLKILFSQRKTLQKRENAGKEMERRIVAQLLTCLDELGEKPDCQVVVIGATNRLDL